MQGGYDHGGTFTPEKCVSSKYQVRFIFTSKNATLGSKASGKVGGV